MAKVLILLFLTISCIPIIAQSDYLFKNISSRDGLSNDFVREYGRGRKRVYLDCH